MKVCERCGFRECACLGGNYTRLFESLCDLCRKQGIQTASASADELIERIERQLTILKRDLQRAKMAGRDPSGRWG